MAILSGTISKSSTDGSWGEESTDNAGDTGGTGLIPGLGRSPRVGNGNAFQYSCLKKIPWTEESGRLQSKGLQRSDTTDQLNMHYILNLMS